MDISINLTKYNEVVEQIETYNNRTNANNSNFDIEFSESKSQVIENYAEAINSIKELLDEYYQAIIYDIDKLRDISRNFEEIG